MKKTYRIDVDCANCANKMEEAARKDRGRGRRHRQLHGAEDDRGVRRGTGPQGRHEQVRKNCKRVEDDCEIFL